MPRRNFPSFIDAFSRYLSTRRAPKEYHLWAGLWCLSAAIERRAACYTYENDLWPNIYVILLGHPASGKSQIVEPCRELITSLGSDRVAPSSMSFASFADHIRDYQRTIIDPKSGIATSYSCVNVLSTEWQVLLPVYDTMILGKMTEIYDCKVYGESRRSEGNNFNVERTCCTMLAATQPAHLFSTMPEIAWSTGFMSRCFIVWSDEINLPSLFGDPSKTQAERMAENKAFMDKLKEDIKIVADLQGSFQFTPEAAALYDTFARTPGGLGGEPIPRHPRLLHYSGRRTQHLLKLGMCSVLDRKEDLLIEVYDYQRAYTWLTGMELSLPRIFEESHSGGDAQVTEDLHHEMSRLYVESGGKAITHRKLTNFLMGRVQSFRHDAIIKTAVAGGWFEEKNLGPPVGKVYIPAAESPFLRERKDYRPKGV